MRTIAVMLAVSLTVILVGCAEEAPESAPKISDMAAERQRVAAKVKKRKGQKAKGRAAASKPDAPGASQLDLSLGQTGRNYVYDAREKRDPFRSTFWERRAADTKIRGPLEQYELGQLSVAAIVWETNRPRALVTDPGGEAYLVKEGSRIGKNDGLVIHIGDNLVLVKETYIDFAGEQSTKDVEMRIRRSQGG